LIDARIRVWLLLLFFTVTVRESRADDRRTPFLEWSTTNIQYMYGFNWFVGKDVVDTFTIEHTDSWRYGDNYFFMDVLNVAEQERHSSFNYYLEYHPRFSLSKIFGLDCTAGPIKDVLIANEFDFADSFFAHSTGIGFSLDLPHFTFVNANFMVRDNVRANGITWHFEVDWGLPFTFLGLPLIYEGYVDMAGPEGSYVETVFSDTQLLLDVGKLLNSESHVFIGVEFRYIHNQFYINGADEYIPQPIVKWVF
jgi:nucleoside-specific outer membrane channel protein Tsx